MLPHFPKRKRPAPIGSLECVRKTVACIARLMVSLYTGTHGYVTLLASISHPSDLCFAQVLLETRVEVVPPLIEHALANQLEPGGELERLVLEHGPKVLLRDESGIANLVGVDIQVNVGLDKKDIVDYAHVSHLLKESIVRLSARHKVSLLSCSPHLPSLGDL
jgi:hypothetical protein